MPLQQIPESSAKSYRTQQNLTALAVRAARRAWGQVDTAAISESWEEPSQALGAVLTRLQSEAALDGARSVPAALADQGFEVEPEYAVKPRAVGGFAGAGYAPTDVFESAPVVAKTRIAQGWPVAAAMAAGGAMLSGITQTAMADAGRQGQMLAIHSRPKVGYVRMLNPPSCSRCAILAGTASGREPFARHPRCDCRAIPGLEGWEQDLTMDTGEYFASLPSAADLADRYPDLTVAQRRERGLYSQEDAFTKYGAQAIRDGADVNQVVNARRGMKQIQQPGSTRWLVTSAGTASRRGRAARAMDAAGLSVRSADNVMRFRLTRQRLMPETIYQIASSPEETRKLLRMYGYI